MGAAHLLRDRTLVSNVLHHATRHAPAPTALSSDLTLLGGKLAGTGERQDGNGGHGGQGESDGRPG